MAETDFNSKTIKFSIKKSHLKSQSNFESL